MKRWFLALSMMVLAACYDDDVWVLPEAQAIAIVREELAPLDIHPTDTTKVIDGLEVCLADTPCRTVALALDGWDEQARVGFAYITEADRGAPASTATERDEAEALQAELDARADQDGVVLVFREWAHETETLAVEQFRRAVRAVIDARAL